MIISRKLFSKKKKEVTESKQGEKNRKRLVGITSGLATVGSGMILGKKPLKEHIAGRMANKKARDTIIDAAKSSKLDKELKIANRSMEVTNKIVNSNMSLKDRINSIDNLNKAVKIMKNKLDSDYKTVVDEATKNYKKVNKTLNNRFGKSMGKRALIGAGIGTAAGIGMDQLIKHRQKKLGVKRRDD